MFFCSRMPHSMGSCIKTGALHTFSNLVLWLGGVSLYSLECFCASSNFSCGGQRSEAALQKGCAGHANEGSLTYFFALVFFSWRGCKGDGQVAWEKVVCHRGSLLEHLQPSLQPNNLPFQAGRRQLLSLLLSCCRNKTLFL